MPVTISQYDTIRISEILGVVIYFQENVDIDHQLCELE